MHLETLFKCNHSTLECRQHSAQTHKKPAQMTSMGDISQWEITFESYYLNFPVSSIAQFLNPKEICIEFWVELASLKVKKGNLLWDNFPKGNIWLIILRCMEIKGEVSLVLKILKILEFT